tara:strand:- start:19743 stop:20144 length:402 start_codon:yes stop_codon:yes gene_type:complete
MFVVYLDLEGTGKAKPVPCMHVKPLKMLGDNWFKLTGVEQIREYARPTMTVTELMVQVKHIQYIIGGDDPADVPFVETSKTNPTKDEDKEEVSTDTEDKPKATDSDIEPLKTKRKRGRPKGSKNKPKTNSNKK